MSKKKNALDILNNVESERKIAKEIIKTVSEYYNTDLTEDTRRREVSVPRYISVYLVREYTKKVTYDYIGMLFNRDHSGFVTSVKRLKEQIPFDSELRRDLKEIKSLIELSEWYNGSKLKTNLIYESIIHLNTLTESEIKDFNNSLIIYKLNNLQVDSELVN